MVLKKIYLGVSSIIVILIFILVLFILVRTFSEKQRKIRKSSNILVRQYKDEINILEDAAKEIPPNELTTFETCYDQGSKKATTLQETLLQKKKFPVEVLSVKISQNNNDGSKSCIGFDRIQIKKIAYWLYIENSLNVNQGVATLYNGQKISVIEFKKDVQIRGGKRRIISILFDSNKIKF